MTIKSEQADLIQSVADALQFISLLPPAGLYPGGRPRYEREQSPAAKDALAQILTNSHVRRGHRPICRTPRRRRVPERSA